MDQSLGVWSVSNTVLFANEYAVLERYVYERQFGFAWHWQAHLFSTSNDSNWLDLHPVNRSKLQSANSSERILPSISLLQKERCCFEFESARVHDLTNDDADPNERV